MKKSLCPKKTLALLIALLLGLTICAHAEAESPVGDWYMNVIVSDGVKIDPDTLGLDMQIRLNDDGSAAITQAGETVNDCVWAFAEERILLCSPSGDALEMQQTGENLEVIDSETGARMIFGRTRVPLENDALAAVVSAPALSDFEGAWRAESIDMLGTRFSMETLEMELQIVISGETADVTAGEGDVQTKYQTTVVLEGDMLCVQAEGDQAPLNLQLLEDGKLLCIEDSDGVTGVTIEMLFARIDG